MPVTVRKGRGKRPYKIVEVATGRVVGTSVTGRNAHISAWARNRAIEGKPLPKRGPKPKKASRGEARRGK